MIGSSPRGRGKRGGEPVKELLERLIPAWAGKTPGRWEQASSARAHPRVGGENLIGVAADLSAQGSSPRGRGKRQPSSRRWKSRRLIPAWAGKTRRRRQPETPHWAHPRVGGENCPGLCWPPFLSGLVPAWAGKTVVADTKNFSRAAHPRVGGENAARRHLVRKPAGSSPRGRGKPTSRCWRLTSGRLIPAWAGKTETVAYSDRPSTAHPRVGGENTSPMSDLQTRAGSSPRGRGKR